MADDNSELPGYRPTRPVPDPTQLTNELVEKATTGLREILETRLSSLDQRVSSSEHTLTRHVDIAIKTLEQLVTAKITANTDAIDVLRHASEQRLHLMESMTTRNQDECDAAREALHALLDEKIRSLTDIVAVFKTAVNERFQLGDVQTEKASLAAKEALSAAFAAAKEAVGEQNKSNALSISKSEVATTKQIDQLVENLRLSDKTTADKIEVLGKVADSKYDDLKERLVAMEARGTVADPATAATLRELSNTVVTLNRSNDQGSGARTRGQEISGTIITVITMCAIVSGTLLGVFVAIVFHH